MYHQHTRIDLGQALLGLAHADSWLIFAMLPRHLVKSAYQKTIFLISQPKHMLWVLKRTISYVVGTQKNRLNETVLISTQKHMLKLMGKKIFIILH